MKEYILITGASSGIGYEMAKLLAEKRFNLILVARSVDKLIKMQESFSHTYQISVEYVEADLSMPQVAIDLYEEIISRELIVTHLVNNAGFGGYGSFLQTSLDHELDMINLNVSSLVVLYLSEHPIF